MVFSYNWLQSFFKKKLPSPEKLAEILALQSFEVEEVAKKGKDWVLDIAVLPNRAPDCFSHLGVAREIAVITKSQLQVPKAKGKEEKSLLAKNFVSIEVQDKTACPRYTARVIKGVKVASSPKWLKDRLIACGLRPINNIVDIANYVMLDSGQPLHAFDGEKIAEKKIIVRFAKDREKIVTLDEEKYDLDKSILVIADPKKALAIAGIKGGKLPEIDKKTRVVVLESANFDPHVIRKASQTLHLRTDASLRFEHGLDPNLTELAINRAALLIEQIGGGKVAQGLVDVYPKKSVERQVRLELHYLNSLLGVQVPKKEAKDILVRLGFGVREKGKVLYVTVPTRRLDVSLPEDLIEEIGRIYGYNKVKALFPMASLIPPKRNLNIFWENVVKDILKEARFREIYNYSFLSEEQAKIFGKEYLIEVENPLSVEYKYLRDSLIPNLLVVLKKNQKNFKNIKIFELGKIFKKPKLEKKQLTALIQGDSFFQLKGALDFLFERLGISDAWYDDYQATPEDSPRSIWHPRKVAEVKVNGDEIGFLGELSPKLLDKLEIKERVVAFDIDFEKLETLSSEETIFQPVSRFPAAVRDLAILIPQGTKVVEVLNVINRVGGKLVRDADLFDMYEGEELPEGKKNLAFHIVFQAEDKTLNAKEIDQLQKKIIAALEENPDWQVRGR